MKFGNKNYFKIKMYLETGRLESEEANATNFHPSQVNEICYSHSEKEDYCFSIVDEKNINKGFTSIIKDNLRKVKKELTVLRKQEEAYEKALSKINENV